MKEGKKMGCKQILVRDTGVDIYRQDYYAMGANAGVSAAIRDFLVKEYHAILAGDREELREELRKIHAVVGLTDEADEALREIKRFYGFKCSSDAIRLAIRNWLRAS